MYIIILIIILIYLIIYLLQDLFLFPYISKILIKYSANEELLDNGNLVIKEVNNNNQITIFFPGNAMHVDIIKNNFAYKNVIIVNYRPMKNDGYFYGFGNKNHAIKNGIEAYKWGLENYNEVKVVVFSIGNGVFSEVYKTIVKDNLQRPKEIISINGLTNLKDIVINSYGLFTYPYYYFITSLNSEDNYIKHLDDNVPYKFIHGDKDKIIPHSLVKKMYKNMKKAKKNVSLITIENANHNDIDIYSYL